MIKRHAFWQNINIYPKSIIYKLFDKQEEILFYERLKDVGPGVFEMTEKCSYCHLLM